MKAIQLNTPSPIDELPLQIVERAIPEPGDGQILIKVSASGVCHTDLHEVEGDISPAKIPVIPGHQVVGVVHAIGPGVTGWTEGDRAGIPWLYSSCDACDFCKRGEENLCPHARFTGFHTDGGYAEYALAEGSFALHIPDSINDVTAAPLLCAGIIGYRSLRKADVQHGERIGLIGFGASAHLAIQVAKAWGCEVCVFTRSHNHRQLASELGADWVGGIEDDFPLQLDRAILFAPEGSLVPEILEKLRPGGTLAINAIHLSPIPEMEYSLIYGERTLRSVANASYLDGVEFLELAASIPIIPRVVHYPLDGANQALSDLKHSRINGAGVLIP